MTYYAHYNPENGTIQGFYTKKLHGGNIPLPNIALTEEQWKAALEAPHVVKDGELVPAPPPPPHVPTKPERITTLTAEYEPRFEALRKARVSVQASGWGDDEVAKVDAEYRALLAEFNAKMEAILNG